MIDSQTIKSQRQARAQRSVSARRGVSLIEVLVVLVLLVTGILVIIRLFPSGFFSIQSTGNAALADGLGNAALGTQAQDAASLPEAILPVNTLTNPQGNLTTAAYQYANYDPDDPSALNNARVVSNETITIPSPSNNQSVYAVKYGPIVLGTLDGVGKIDPSGNVTQVPSYLTINSLPWTVQNGSSIDELNPTVEANPKDLLAIGRPNYLVDFTNGKIAVPPAAYSQNFVLVVQGTTSTQTIYLTVPAQNANGPVTDDKLAFRDSTNTEYNGKWFDPLDTTLAYATTPIPPAPGAPWKSVMLYRQFNAVSKTTTFTSDPYQFKLTAANIGTANANPGAIAFNPLAGGANGLPPLKAQISYVTYSWGILREDHDIPALSGTSTTVIRTTVPNLLQAGAAEPDNSLNPGIAGSGKSLYLLDLDTGQSVAAPAATDPTNPDAPIYDEDTNGSNADPKVVNVSFATGRLTFGSQVFGDTKAHRVRIFYGSELGWTVAVQKAPSYFTPNTTAAAPYDTTPLKATEYAVLTGANTAFVYFARCNAGRTVEVDGTYTDTNGASQTFTNTISIDPTLNSVGASNVRINLMDTRPGELGQPVPQSATNVKVTAVRGLSARAVVAWKERDQWKVHSVDTVLNRTL